MVVKVLVLTRNQCLTGTFGDPIGWHQLSMLCRTSAKEHFTVSIL